MVFGFFFAPFLFPSMKLHSAALITALALFASACASSAPTAAVKAAPAVLQVADPFGSEMVLQRGVPVPVWGTTDAGATVRVAFAGQTKSASADANGRWQVTLDPMPACAENRVMTLSAGGKVLEFKDVLVGEVWMCSGQSNMQWGVRGAANGPAEVAAADHPLLRLRYSNLVLAPVPQTHVNGSAWKICTPQNLGQGTHANSFSATAYYFGRDLQADLNVPVGVIQSAWAAP